MVALLHVTASCSHLLYMDDLKLCGRTQSQLNGLLHTVSTFSDDTLMKLGLDKCCSKVLLHTLFAASCLDRRLGRLEDLNQLSKTDFSTSVYFQRSQNMDRVRFSRHLRIPPWTKVI